METRCIGEETCYVGRLKGLLCIRLDRDQAWSCMDQGAVCPWISWIEDEPIVGCMVYIK